MIKKKKEEEEEKEERGEGRRRIKNMFNLIVDSNSYLKCNNFMGLKVFLIIINKVLSFNILFIIFNNKP